MSRASGSGSSGDSDEDYADGYKNGSSESQHGAEECKPQAPPLEEIPVTGHVCHECLGALADASADRLIFDLGQAGGNTNINTVGSGTSQEASENLETVTVTGRIKIDPCKSEDGKRLTGRDSSLILWNDRNEPLTVKFGTEIRRLDPYRALGPIVSSVPLVVQVSTPSGNNFDIGLKMVPGWQADIVVLDTMDKWLNSGAQDFSQQHNLYWPSSRNENYNMALHDMQDIKADVIWNLGLKDIKLMDITVPRCTRR